MNRFIKILGFVLLGMSLASSQTLLNLSPGPNTQVKGVLGPVNGGLGTSSLTAHCVLVGEGANLALVCPGVAGGVLTSAGPTADPSFQSLPAITASQMPAFSGDCSTSAGATLIACGTAIARTGVDINTSFQVTALHLLAPTLCASGNYAQGIDTSGNAAGCTPAFTISNFAPHTFFGNNTGSTAAPSASAINEADVTNLISDLALKAPLASPTFTGTVTMPAPTFNSLLGSVQCLHINSSGTVSGTGSDCNTGGGGGSVTSVTGTANQIVVVNGSTTPTVSIASPFTFPGTVSNNLSIFAATTSAQLAGILSDETGSGAAVFGTSPTIVTPTIASFVNATHNHTNATGGGTLTLAGAAFANQGTTTTVLHGNAAGNPSFGQVVNGDIANGTIDLSAKVTGVLSFGNGGLGTGSNFSAHTFFGNNTGVGATPGAESINEADVTNLTTDLAAKVPTTLTVNGKALSGNITLGLASADFVNQGTTTTVLIGNAAGNPSFGAVNLATMVTGNLPIANLNSGTSASSTTFWRGDGTWAAPSVSGMAFSGLTSATNNVAAMVVGTGASLAVSGSGAIGATTLLGNTWSIPGAIGATTPNTGVFTDLSANDISGTGTGTGVWAVRGTAGGECQFSTTSTGAAATFDCPVKTLATVFANLPACSSALEGSRQAVTDSTTATWGATVTGGSTNHIEAYCDGTNWTVAAK